MRRSPFAALGIGLAALGLVLTGCATPAPVETPAASSPAEPTPTIEPVVIGPAEMPPVAFGGDCAKVLTTDDLFEVTGIEFALQDGVEDNPVTDNVVANVGGLECSWAGGDSEVYLDTIPQAGLDGTRFPHVEDYFEECDRVAPGCGWYQSGDALWTSVYFATPGVTREQADVWGEELGRRVAENHTATAAEPWTRDRSGWWPVFDCAQIAAAVNAQAGDALLVGEVDGFRGGPGPEMAREASRETQCTLTSPEGAEIVRMTTRAGVGDVSDSSTTMTPVDSGVPGISMSLGGDEGGGTEWYVLSDGVNTVRLSASASALNSPEELALAVAAAAASGFE
ncbi:hypothetical protein [Microbacterium sp. Root180]|uniref:hypothetical protein n=1 Tax=Microbacterium sp. Root180 TaxID=1736483 RepID=UPI0006F9DF11|nr:hypothetical protein [Microbacterium sp. Root180]KRB38484.1 hypothetical protein ASD93_00475 [Microbacterium sp. Root180]